MGRAGEEAVPFWVMSDGANGDNPDRRRFLSWATPARLATAGLLAWGLAIVVQWRWRADGLAGTFVGAGVVLLLVAAFHGRIHGPTKIDKDGIATNIDRPADVKVSGNAQQGPLPASAATDTATLSARWPTLNAALQSIPVGWTKDQREHADGQQYIHVRSPLGGFEVTINLAACDSPAPPWLLAAINAMSSSEAS